jgi:hypothetical protein
MAAKQAPSKAEKTTKAPQKKLPSHQSTIEKTLKAPQKKPPSHESTTEKTTKAQSSSVVQPPKQKNH